MKSLPLKANIQDLGKLVSSHACSVWLDSSDPKHSHSHYSYFAFEPKEVLSGFDSPWPRLKAWMDNRAVDGKSSSFTSGLLGYLSYECFQFLDPYQKIKTSPTRSPLYWFGYYEWLVVYDHQTEQLNLVSDVLSEEALRQKQAWLSDVLTRLAVKDSAPQKAIVENDFSFDLYSKKINRIKKYLSEGDCYQINLTHEFKAVSSKNVWELYSALRKASPVPYSALINAGDFQVLSASPEELIYCEGKSVRTRPIKGTIKRDDDFARDEKNKMQLLQSIKNRAELLMIVDLERNDLGRFCEFGSVKVEENFKLESFANLHHLVATVSGKIRDGFNFLDALMAIFPGGSVTGAPKKRAMEIISELEEQARGVYCGAVGFLSPTRAHFNLPIRSLLKKSDEVFYYAGGGIVFDSVAEDEYEELLTKSRGVKKALE